MSTKLQQALDLIDAANSEDPNIVVVDGKEWHKELLYSRRMTDMLHRFVDEPDEVAKLAMRAQHIQRWKKPREDYPMNRQGYLQWRTGLYKFHAEKIGALMQEVGYGTEIIERVKQAVGKRTLKRNPDAQLLEDVADLVFIEHYMLEFAGKHTNYSEDKWLNIIRKTWKKMSPQARSFALSGGIQLPKPLIPLIQKAVAEPLV